MAYLGQAPINGFHAKQQLTGDGSTVTFTLDQTCATETSMIVSVGGILQEPSTAYDLVQGGTKITFTEAPASTDRVYIQFLGKAIVQNLLAMPHLQKVISPKQHLYSELLMGRVFVLNIKVTSIWHIEQ